MIFGPVSKEMVFEWRKIHGKFKDKLQSNRKSGKEVLEYLQNKSFEHTLNNLQIPRQNINN